MEPDEGEYMQEFNEDGSLTEEYKEDLLRQMQEVRNIISPNEQALLDTFKRLGLEWNLK
jgi:hypothetical protein